MYCTDREVGSQVKLHIQFKETHTCNMSGLTIKTKKILSCSFRMIIVSRYPSDASFSLAIIKNLYLNVDDSSYKPEAL